MKIVCIGGGPAGLYFALLMKQLDPAHDITVVERNKPYDTFGWGVVFSDADDGQHAAVGPGDRRRRSSSLQPLGRHRAQLQGPRRCAAAATASVGIGRKKLLNILQARCEELGVELLFETDVDSDADFPDADLVIASDGINSKHPQQVRRDLQARHRLRRIRFIWLGTHKLLRRLHLRLREDRTWLVPGPRLQVRRQHHHLHRRDARSVSGARTAWTTTGQEESIAFCEKLFAEDLRGHKLMTNARHLRGSAWLNFQRVICEQWSHFNGRSHVVLMGDAAHTAHFAIGSGTKLAIEDAIELPRSSSARRHGRDPRGAAALPGAAQRRRAAPAERGLERDGMVRGRRPLCRPLPPEQFMYSMLTRRQRISHENLRLRDKAWLEGYERWFAAARRRGSRCRRTRRTAADVHALHAAQRRR